MSRLGTRLEELRTRQQRSRRWVEGQSHRLHPEDREMQISHSYLRQLEAGTKTSPSPPKLRALAKILQADYEELMFLAGYIDRAPGESADAAPPVLPEAALRERLRRAGLNPDLFLAALSEMSAESLQLVSRLVTTLSVQERRLRRAESVEAKT